ncbi:MAG: glycosyltransferase family 2 protein [Prochlorococcaceae cyanobacterium]
MNPDVLQRLQNIGLQPVDDAGSKGFKPTPGAVLAFSCVRNELLRLPYFLKYHRDLGVDHFYVVDNGSNDGSTSYLSQEADVSLYSAAGSYADSHCGVLWLNALLHAHGQGHWCLILDADELFVYHQCEFRTVQELTAWLSQIGGNAMPGFLIDMYSNTSIQSTRYSGEGSFLDVCSYFDVDTYYAYTPEGLPARGGPRHRLFWQGRERTKPAPVLHKTPLVRWNASMNLEASTHRIQGIERCPATCAILHFKLFSDFVTTTSVEAVRGEHWDNGYQYSVYNEVMRANPSLSGMYSGSQLYQNSQQLADMKLISTLWACDSAPDVE